MTDLYLIAIHELASEVTIDLMEIQTVVTCDKGLHEFDILAHLVNITGTSRIVSSCLDTTRERIITLETYYVVGLPAMQ